MAGGLLSAALGLAVLAQVNAPGRAGRRWSSRRWSSRSGMAPVFGLTTELIVGSAPPEKAGAASGISETGAELGARSGISVLGSIGIAIYRGHLADGAARRRARRPPPRPPAIRSGRRSSPPQELPAALGAGRRLGRHRGVRPGDADRRHRSARSLALGVAVLVARVPARRGAADGRGAGGRGHPNGPAPRPTSTSPARSLNGRKTDDPDHRSDHQRRRRPAAGRLPRPRRDPRRRRLRDAPRHDVHAAGHATRWSSPGSPTSTTSCASSTSRARPGCDLADPQRRPQRGRLRHRRRRHRPRPARPRHASTSTPRRAPPGPAPG